MISAPAKNYFAASAAAANYRQGRPYFHADTIDRVRHFLGLDEKVERALDIACGTGLSTQALLEIAVQVHDTDSAEEMLRLAYEHPRIRYVQAPAEHQPFPDQSFDLITVCSGVHWFDIDAFLIECRRLVRDGGWLILYDNFFLGEIARSADFQGWYESTYLTAFPPPARNDNYNWNSAQLAALKLEIAHEEQYTNQVLISRPGLVQYLITQSNIISAVDSGAVSYEAVAAWLDKELEPFFPHGRSERAFCFGNWIRYIKALQ